MMVTRGGAGRGEIVAAALKLPDLERTVPRAPAVVATLRGWRRGRTASRRGQGSGGHDPHRADDCA